MVKITVKVEDVQSFEGSLESWEKHKKLILWWCSGKQVEYCIKPGKFAYCHYPKFNTTVSYRQGPRIPETGQVWIHKKGRVPYIYVEGLFLSLEGNITTHKDCYLMTFSSLCAKDYYDSIKNEVEYDE